MGEGPFGGGVLPWAVGAEGRGEALEEPRLCCPFEGLQSLMDMAGSGGTENGSLLPRPAEGLIQVTCGSMVPISIIT